MIPLCPCLSLEHALERIDHIKCLNILELLLQVRLHVSKHDATDLCRLVMSPTISIFYGDWLFILRFVRNRCVQNMFLFSCLRTILKLRYQLVKLVPFSLSFSRIDLKAKLDI